MRTDLKVPFSEKDEAKHLGARWDPKNKTWYIENQQPISKFSKWMQTPLSPNSSSTSRNEAQKVTGATITIQPDVCDCTLMWECDSCRSKQRNAKTGMH